MNRRKFIIGTTITGTCLPAFQQLQGLYQLARPKFQHTTVHSGKIRGSKGSISEPEFGS